MIAILVDLPNRYNLPVWSCVNLEVSRTNRGLQDISSKHTNAFLVEASKGERHFHPHLGLYLNHRGKKLLSEIISEVVAAKQKPERPFSESDEQTPSPEETPLLQYRKIIRKTFTNRS